MGSANLSETITDEEIEQARARGEAAMNAPGAVAEARYEVRGDRIAMRFNSGAILAIPRRAVAELRAATPAQLRGLRAVHGDGLELRALDIDIAIPGLIAEFVGTTATASEMGRRGGSVRSAAKTAAVRANGKKGGRPRKNPALEPV